MTMPAMDKRSIHTARSGLQEKRGTQRFWIIDGFEPQDHAMHLHFHSIRMVHRFQPHFWAAQHLMKGLPFHAMETR